MKKNGFTLVELLAVIVILAIVLIIAVPGVLSIINKTKDNALDRQLDMIKEASRLYVTTDNNVIWMGQDSKITVVSLDTLKAGGYLDQKIMDPQTKKEITCAKTTITKSGSKYNYDVQLCDQVNASPRISSTMIPITYNGSAWVKADATNKENGWYNYENRQWANVALVTKETREQYQQASTGTVIDMEDITMMYTWIPRFKYKLWNTEGSLAPTSNPNMAGDYLIDVEIEDVTTPKSMGTQNGQWLTHPAFTFNGEELTGFWVGKFETGYNGATTLEEAQKNIADTSKLIVKPNVHSWRVNRVYNIFYMIRDLDKQKVLFGTDPGNSSHMIKNMEWGAMAYLSYSKYGKAGNPIYTGAAKEVMRNNNSLYITGCGTDNPTNAESTICNEYQTTIGQMASTTGNITGIYDTSGGAWEYVAGYYEGVDNKSGFTQAQLTPLASTSFMEAYKAGDTFNGSRLGDAIKESFEGLDMIHSLPWYGDLPNLISPDKPWYVRSSGYQYTNSSGIMSIGVTAGDGSTDRTFRIVLL